MGVLNLAEIPLLKFHGCPQIHVPANSVGVLEFRWNSFAEKETPPRGRGKCRIPVDPQMAREIESDICSPGTSYGNRVDSAAVRPNVPAIGLNPSTSMRASAPTEAGKNQDSNVGGFSGFAAR
jgi:hypothetical protein